MDELKEVGRMNPPPLPVSSVELVFNVFEDSPHYVKEYFSVVQDGSDRAGVTISTTSSKIKAEATYIPMVLITLRLLSSLQNFNRELGLSDISGVVMLY